MLRQRYYKSVFTLKKHLNYTGNGFELRKNFFAKAITFFANAAFKSLALLSK
jgi:hypothetical protein